jgi:hypothetical protein
MRGVLHHRKTVALGNFPDTVHLAGDACVVHDENRLGSRRYRSLDERLIEVEGVAAHVDEDWNGTPLHDRIGGRGKRERGHDDLVPRLQLAEDCSHFERGCARGNEQSHWTGQRLLQPALASR